VPGSIEGYARHIGGALGGAVVGVAIGVGIDPILAAHHWPLISQQLTDTLTGVGGGIAGNELAARTRATRAFFAEQRKRHDLQPQIKALREQIATIPDETVREKLEARLGRRLADWEKGAIKTTTFERAFNEIRDDYLSATGSPPARRRGRADKMP
jgi:hypothetical protein